MTRTRRQVIKDKIKILTELKKRLNGKCSNETKTCPRYISEDDPDEIYYWECVDCLLMFRGIVDLKKVRNTIEPFPKECYPCPCAYVPDIALTRLTEYIIELKNRLKN